MSSSSVRLLVLGFCVGLIGCAQGPGEDEGRGRPRPEGMRDEG